MSKTINITIKDKVARQTDKTLYICGNSDFTVNFVFDDDWNEFSAKTARFIHSAGYTDVVFLGDQCPIPKISNTHNIKVGVFAGDLRTTTPALISAKKSILCESGIPAPPSEDVYAQIMEVIIPEAVVDAEESARQAAVSEQKAKNSETAAIQAKEAAVTAEQTAKTSAAQTKTSEANAKISEDNAKTSEDNAKTSENNAKASETSASGSASSATLAKENAEKAKTDAEAAATRAETASQGIEQFTSGAEKSATDAKEAAQKAEQHEANAKTAEKKAQNIEADVIAVAQAVAEDKTQVEIFVSRVVSAVLESKQSEQNAKTSENNSAQSAASAVEAERNARFYEKSASEYAKSAAQSEQNAKTSETNAKTSETNAKTSETNAVESEREAMTYATKAAQSAKEAFDAEGEAKTHEVSARSHMQLASKFSGEAEESAAAAAKSAEEAKNAAESIVSSESISPTATVTQTDSGAIVTITDKNGTTTATLTNGKDGVNGVSPTIDVSKSGKVTTLTIKDVNGTQTATIKDGEDGSGGSGGGGAQPDWNADEGEPGHILNRPCYDGIFVDRVVAKRGLKLAEYDGISGFMMPDVVTVFTGEEYTVNYNGMDVNCTCVEITFMGLPMQAMGNLAAMNGVGNTGEPFVLLVVPAEYAGMIGFGIGIVPLDGSTTLNVSVRGLTPSVKPIPTKYLPRYTIVLNEDEKIMTGVTPHAVYSSQNRDEFAELLYNGGDVWIDISAPLSVELGAPVASVCKVVSWFYSDGVGLGLYFNYMDGLAVAQFATGTWTPPGYVAE